MLVSVRHAWLWTAAGTGLATALFGGYLALRAALPLPPPAWWEPLPVLCLLAIVCAPLSTWAALRHGDHAFRTLARRVAALRENPSLTHLQEVAPDLGPLYDEVEALMLCYRNVLANLVEQTEALNESRREQANAKLGRADSEQGQSLFRVLRGGTDSRSMVARLTPNLHWLALTPALQQFLGVSLDRLSGRPFAEVVHPDDVQELLRTLHETLDVGEGHNIVFRLVVPGGGERHVQMDVLTRYDSHSAPLHLRCHLTDVSARVTAERELRRRTEELSQANRRLQKINLDLETLKNSYRDLYNNAPTMYFSMDPGGRFVTCNETMLRTLGYEREELQGRRYTRLLAPDRRAEFRADPGVYQRPGQVQTKWLKRDGTVIDVLVHNTPKLDPQGGFLRSRSAAQDMTEHNRLADALRAKADELQKANAQLRRINRELDDFTYVVSHDLKEPLRTLEAFSNFLALDYSPQLGPEGQEFISHLTQASRRLGALIDDLLTLSRVGRITHAPQVFDLTDVMQTVVGDLSDLIQRRGAEVRIEGLMPAVAGDAQRITQLLTNLVGNGLKYNRSEHPWVVISTDAAAVAPNSEPDLQLDALAPPKADPAFVTVCVRDNGIGIDPKYHKQVFRIFKRLHRREEYEGTGAGLAICKKIIEAHGGRIWVESQPGQGAAFYFTLPRPGVGGLRDLAKAASNGSVVAQPPAVRV